MRSLSNYHVKTAFLSGRSISAEQGLGEIDPAEIELKRALVTIADSVVVLLDSSKWQEQSLQSTITLDKLYAGSVYYSVE